MSCSKTPHSRVRDIFHQWMKGALFSALIFGINVYAAYELPDTEVHEIRSEILKRNYKLYVKLPPNYHDEANTSRKYPVVYLNDGPSAFHLAAGINHTAMINRVMEHHILIGVSYSLDDKSFVSRRRDYTPKQGEQTGEADRYLQFFQDELFPFAESTYRINNLRRAYAGYSLGGIFGLYALFNASESFRYYLISSPSIWFGKRWALAREQEYAQQYKDLNAEVFFGVGELERPALKDEPYSKPTPINMVADLEQLYQQLQSRDYPSLRLNRITVANAHNELSYPTVLSQGLYWLFPGEKYQTSE